MYTNSEAVLPISAMADAKFTAMTDVHLSEHALVALLANY